MRVATEVKPAVRGVTQGVWWLSARAAAVASLAPAVLALFVCAHQLTLHGVLHGVVLRTESPNLGSGIALSRGQLPYADFALAQPPGMPLLMLPFGWLHHAVAGSIVLPLARCFTCAVAVASVYLAGLAASSYGVPASLIAGTFTAVYPFQFFSTAGVTAAPYVLFFSLLGMNLAFKDGAFASRVRILIAGLSLGFACTIEPWAIVPALIFLGCVALASERRVRLLPAAGGLVIGGGVPCLIFAAAAPSRFWREAILTELPRNGTMHAADKLATVLGLGDPSGFSHPAGLATALTVLIVAAVIGVCALGWSGSTPRDWLFSLTAVAVLLAVLLPGNMSVGYGEFALPFLAIAVGVTISRLIALVASLWSPEGSQTSSIFPTSLAAIATGCMVLVAALGASTQGSYGARYAEHHALIVRAQIDHEIPASACAISDVPMLLVEANRDDASATCPVIVDPAGVISIAAANHGIWSPRNVWAAWGQRARYAVIPVVPTDLPVPAPDVGSLLGGAALFSDSRITILIHAV